jgi:formylglycine-generating enzyme required for sulfatase activity
LLLLLLAIGGVAWLKQDALRERYVWYHDMKAPLFPVGDRESRFADCDKGCPRMVVLPGCRFTMGSEEPPTALGEQDKIYSSPPHEVTIARPFAVSMAQITFEEWNACVRAGGCQPLVHEPLKGAARATWNRDDQPVIEVGWPHAVAYTKWLSKLSGKHYRLLSEAEWEYAARAGSTAVYSFGDDESQLEQHAWFKDNSGGTAHPVGQKPANAFGLRDMPGNLKEWVGDPLHANYEGAPKDGTAWGADDADQESWRRVVRGGAFDSPAEQLRSASRDAGTADGRGYSNVGFRVARTLDGERESMGGCKGQ